MSHFVVPWFLDRQAAEPGLIAGSSAKVIEARPGAGDQLEGLAPIHQALAAAVERDVAQGQVPTCYVGDCCQSIAIMAGLARNGIHPTLIWFDAHGDFNTWETSASKFVGGMPLAMLTGRGDQRLLHAVGLNAISDDKVILADARDLDAGERQLVEASGVLHIKDVDELVELSLPKGPIYVHFDTDIIDSSSAPAFMYPVTGGPLPHDMNAVLHYLKATGQVVAWSVCAAWDHERKGSSETLAAIRSACAGVTS